MPHSWRDQFILRCGFDAMRAKRSDPQIASVVGTAWAVAEQHLLPRGRRPAVNDN